MDRLDKISFQKRDPEMLKLWARLAQSSAITPEDYFDAIGDVKGEKELRGVLDGTIKLPELTAEEQAFLKSRGQRPDLKNLLETHPEDEQKEI